MNTTHISILISVMFRIEEIWEKNLIRDANITRLVVSKIKLKYFGRKNRTRLEFGFICDKKSFISWPSPIFNNWIWGLLISLYVV